MKTLLSGCPVRQFGKPVLSVRVSGFKVLNDSLLKVHIIALNNLLLKVHVLVFLFGALMSLMSPCY